MAPINKLIPLCRRRWSIPILARLNRRHGDRFVPLVHSLHASPEAIREALRDLIDQGLIGPNPGYGHPLRPEYILTARGHRLAPACERLDSTIRALGLQDTCLRRWSLPVLFTVGEGAAHFSEIGRRLGDVTDRALSLTLTSLDDAAVLVRRLMEDRPPRFAYSLGQSGQEIHRIVAGL